MPTLVMTAFSPFPSSSDPAPRREERKSHDDCVERQQNFVERGHCGLEPVDQSGGDHCNNPSGNEWCEAPTEKRPSQLGAGRLG